MKTKYVCFDCENEVCKGIDEHPNIHIISIVHNTLWITLYYQE